MGSFYIYKCQWHGCNMKAEALDDLLSHIETVHIPKERPLYDEADRRISEVPLSCIFNYTSGPVRLRYKKSRMQTDKFVREGYSNRIEKECTSEQLDDRFNFDEDDFAAHPPPITDEHILKMDVVTSHTQNPRTTKTGILKANARSQESHKCHCGKSYRNINGLRNHMVTYHAARGSQISTEET